jgi:hypothetical protein
MKYAMQFEDSGSSLSKPSASDLRPVRVFGYARAPVLGVRDLLLATRDTASLKTGAKVRSTMIGKR